MSSTTDRRCEPRAPLVCELFYEVEGVRFSGQATDVSAGGMYIDSRQPPAAGSPLKIEFLLEGRTICLRGEVAYSQPPIGFGVSFTFTNPDDRERLRRFVASRAPVGVS